MTDPYLLYITVPERESALELARGLIASGLAAGANISGPVHSCYRWQGEIHEAQEWQIFVQTADADAATEWISGRHPHQTPCIIAVPIPAGFTPFLDWIKSGGQDLCKRP